MDPGKTNKNDVFIPGQWMALSRYEETIHACALPHKLFLSNEVFKNKFFDYIKWPILPKTKDMPFRIINHVYPAPEILRKRFVLR